HLTWGGRLYVYRRVSSTLPPPPDIYTLSLHDALPIWDGSGTGPGTPHRVRARRSPRPPAPPGPPGARRSGDRPGRFSSSPQGSRSEGHTSELQSRFDLVCRLLLEKKNKLNKKQRSSNT